LTDLGLLLAKQSLQFASPLRQFLVMLDQFLEQLSGHASWIATAFARGCIGIAKKIAIFQASCSQIEPPRVRPVNAFPTPSLSNIFVMENPYERHSQRAGKIRIFPRMSHTPPARPLAAATADLNAKLADVVRRSLVQLGDMAAIEDEMVLISERISKVTPSAPDLSSGGESLPPEPA
jgi:hypothetical protein